MVFSPNVSFLIIKSVFVDLVSSLVNSQNAVEIFRYETNPKCKKQALLVIGTTQLLNESVIMPTQCDFIIVVYSEW